MKKHIAALSVAASVLAALCPNVSAQTNIITVTNFVTVTVTVTNFVTLTNVPAKAVEVAKTGAMTATNEVVKLPKYPWASSVTAGLTLTRGNSDTLLVTGGVETHKKTPDNEIGMGADGGYGTSGGKKNVDTAHGFTQYNHFFSDRFYGYGRVEALHDGIANLQYRITVGPGVGYYFLKETNTTLAGELGSSYVNERLGDVTDNYDTLRAAERFEHKFKDYGARLWENAEILPQVDKFQNYLVNAEVGIEAALNSHLSLKTFLDDNFNNEPAAGREKNDIRLVSGISYKF